MENYTSTEIKKKKKWVIPVVIASAVILFAAISSIIVIVSVVAFPKARIRKQLELGEKYLTEMDYENAILAYKEAINIDPKNEEAYIGLYDAYLGLADQCIEDGDTGGAQKNLNRVIKELEQGVTLTSSEKIADKLAEMEELKKEIKSNNTDYGKESENDSEKESENEEEFSTEIQYDSYVDAYEDFVLNEKYRKPLKYYSPEFGESCSLEFGTEKEIFYMIYDMDKDGIPELLVEDGYLISKPRDSYAFTFYNGNVYYLGICGADSFYVDDPQYPGIFGLVADGYESWTYYSKDGNSIHTKWVCRREPNENGIFETVEIGDDYSWDEVDRIIHNVNMLFLNKNAQNLRYEDIESGSLR